MTVIGMPIYISHIYEILIHIDDIIYVIDIIYYLIFLSVNQY